jgi:hypothetical protein
MAKEEKENKSKCSCRTRGECGAVYCMGLIGALIYFVPQAYGLQQILIAIFKSIIWPGLVVYKTLGFFNF